MENMEKSKLYLFRLGIVLLAVLSLYFLAKVFTEIKTYKFIGGGAPASNVISFDGKGEVSASPDLAVISFTIREESKEVKDAQTKVTAKETGVLEFLKSSGIAEKDIKTESYNSYPKYDYGSPCYGYQINCRRAPEVIGYEVSEYISVKVRDLAKAGEIVKGIGDLGIAEISGPDFSIEKEDELKAEARKIAIKNAKEKAEILARDLGVKLVRIVSFSEGGSYPMPYYEKGLMMADSRMAVEESAPQLPTGENKITSNVTITYEIR